jgi:hypothetical protein
VRYVFSIRSTECKINLHIILTEIRVLSTPGTDGTPLLGVGKVPLTTEGGALLGDPLCC